MDIISIIIILGLSYCWWRLEKEERTVFGTIIFGIVLLGLMIWVTPIFSLWFDSFFIHLFGFIPLITPLCVFISTGLCVAVVTVLVYLIVLSIIMILDIDELVYDYKRSKTIPNK